ncbi:Putative adhesin domain-containing protein OS=Streptomyces alboniger OX=132473 GN=CP975_25485 PE=4 SV=1 [Streptomyces alboniger]
MPAFDTPRPITVTVTLDAGNLRVVAGDGAKTVVEVRPGDEGRDADVRAAERTRVEFSDGTLLVKGPKERSLFGKGSSLDVEITLPAGSEVRGTGGMVHCVTRGRLGECVIKTSAGDIQVERAAGVRLSTGFGEVGVGRAEGRAEVSTASGEIRLGAVTGAASVKNSNGAVSLGEIGGPLEVKASNGTVTVERAAADVTVRTANGAIRVGELARGSAVLETAAGAIEFGIREGTAAFLDVRTRVGSVSRTLPETGDANEPTDTLRVRARTGMGNIAVGRA